MSKRVGVLLTKRQVDAADVKTGRPARLAATRPPPSAGPGVSGPAGRCIARRLGSRCAATRTTTVPDQSPTVWQPDRAPAPPPVTLPPLATALSRGLLCR